MILSVLLLYAVTIVKRIGLFCNNFKCCRNLFKNFYFWANMFVIEKLHPSTLNKNMYNYLKILQIEEIFNWNLIVLKRSQ